MRVVLDARVATSHFPGIGRYTIELARTLPRLGEDLELILLLAPGSAGEWAFPANSRCVVVEASPFSLRQQWAVPRCLAELKPDVYHSPAYLMPYRSGKRTALTCYDLIPLVYPSYFSPSRALAFRALLHLALRTSRIVLSISESTKRDLVERLHVDPGRIRVTPLAAADTFRPLPADESRAVRDRLGLSAPFFLTVGTNKPHKNLVLLVRAFADLVHELPATLHELLVVGPWDPRYPEVRLFARDLGIEDRVRFLGQVPDSDLVGLYGEAQAVLFPSTYEGFGLPVVEAMQCGTPVLCSNVSSLPEVAGDAAVLLDPRDVGAWAQALRRVVEDDTLRSRLRTASLERAKRFSWENTARLTYDAYRTLTNSGPP